LRTSENNSSSNFVVVLSIAIGPPSPLVFLTIRTMRCTGDHVLLATQKEITFAGNDLSIRSDDVPRTSRQSICFSRTVKAERGFRRRDVDDKSNAGAEEWPIALSILPNEVEETPRNFIADRLRRRNYVKLEKLPSAGYKI